MSFNLDFAGIQDEGIAAQEHRKTKCEELSEESGKQTPHTWYQCTVWEGSLFLMR